MFVDNKIGLKLGLKLVNLNTFRGGHSLERMTSLSRGRLTATEPQLAPRRTDFNGLLQYGCRRYLN